MPRPMLGIFFEILYHINNYDLHYGIDLMTASLYAEGLETLYDSKIHIWHLPINDYQPQEAVHYFGKE